GRIGLGTGVGPRDRRRQDASCRRPRHRVSSRRDPSRPGRYRSVQSRQHRQAAQLNDIGRADAKAVGEAFSTAGVPIGRSYSSRFYRAIETARLIGGKEPVATNDVTEGGQVVSPNENNRRARALRAMVATAPDPDSNTIIVTHKPNILDAFGRNWFDVKEGEASIFKPDGKGEYALIARVPIDQWAAAKR